MIEYYTAYAIFFESAKQEDISQEAFSRLTLPRLLPSLHSPFSSFWVDIKNALKAIGILRFKMIGY